MFSAFRAIRHKLASTYFIIEAMIETGEKINISFMKPGSTFLATFRFLLVDLLFVLAIGKEEIIYR